MQGRKGEEVDVDYGVADVELVMVGQQARTRRFHCAVVVERGTYNSVSTCLFHRGQGRRRGSLKIGRVHKALSEHPDIATRDQISRYLLKLAGFSGLPCKSCYIHSRTESHHLVRTYTGPTPHCYQSMQPLHSAARRSSCIKQCWERWVRVSVSH